MSLGVSWQSCCGEKGGHWLLGAGTDFSVQGSVVLGGGVADGFLFLAMGNVHRHMGGEVLER
jgi:hypothetical protein